MFKSVLTIVILFMMSAIFSGCTILRSYPNAVSRYSGGYTTGSSGTSTQAQAPICKKCKGAGHYYINGVFYTCTQCGGIGRDWNS